MHIEELKKWYSYDNKKLKFESDEARESFNPSWDEVLSFYYDYAKRRMDRNNKDRFPFMGGCWFSGYLKPFDLTIDKLIPAEPFLCQEKLAQFDDDNDLTPIEVFKLETEEDIIKDIYKRPISSLRQTSSRENIYLPHQEEVKCVVDLHDELLMRKFRDGWMSAGTEYFKTLDSVLLRHPHLHNKYIIVDGSHRAFDQLVKKGKKTIRCINYSNVAHFIGMGLDEHYIGGDRSDVVPEESHVLKLCPLVLNYKGVYSILDLSQNILETNEDCLKETRKIREKLGLDKVMDEIRKSIFVKGVGYE